MKKGEKARYPASPGAALSTSVNKSSPASMFSEIFTSECPSRTLTYSSGSMQGLSVETMGMVKYSSWISNWHLTSFIYNWIILNRPLRNQEHNLQEWRVSNDDDGETNYIPTIINSITDMTHMSQLNSRNKVSVQNLLSELRETINVNNREAGSPLTKHKVVLIGDSNIRGYVHKLKTLLKNNSELYSVIKLVLLQKN